MLSYGIDTHTAYVPSGQFVLVVEFSIDNVDCKVEIDYMVRIEKDWLCNVKKLFEHAIDGATSV